MSFLISPVGRALAGIVVVAGLISAAWFDGHSYGRAAERQKSLSRSIDLIRERSKTNAEISRLDDAALCRELGGSWVQPDNICE